MGLRESLLFQVETADNSGFDLRGCEVESLQRQGVSVEGVNHSRVLEKRTDFSLF